MSGNDGKSPTRALFLVTMFAVLFMSTDWFVNGALRSYTRTFIQPFVSGMYRVSTSLLHTEFWVTRDALQNEVRNLRSELASTQDARAALLVAQKENELLRTMARVAEKTQGVTVPITSSFTSSPYGTFTIGGGSSIGVQVGDAVIAGDGFVLGTVTDVGLDSAVVSAVFAPGASIDVTSNDVGFSLSGRGGGNARAEVPREATLSVGAPVLAPHLANRAVGVIGRIEAASSSAFSDVFVIFPVNTNAIQRVFVTPRI